MFFCGAQRLWQSIIAETQSESYSKFTAQMKPDLLQEGSCESSPAVLESLPD